MPAGRPLHYTAVRRRPPVPRDRRRHDPMPATTAPRQTEHGSLGLSTHRIEAFSDGVFAIVMTLLVFELRVPDLVLGRSPSSPTA